MAQFSSVRVRVPATSANLGPGFDALGLALGVYLTCSIARASDTSHEDSRQGKGAPPKILVSGTDCSDIPCDSSNLVFRSFRHLAPERDASNLQLTIENELPLGRGLGSSAGAIVAGLALANEWYGLSKSAEQLIQAANEIEGHPDNVAAAVRGGLVVSCQAAGGAVISVPCPVHESIEMVLVVPEFQLSTEAARAALPQGYSRADAVFNIQRVALLLTAFRDGSPAVFAEAIRDRLHQPYRARLVPGFEDALKLSDIPGLLGVALSGAGPSVIAFCNGNAEVIGNTVASCFAKQNVKARARHLPLDRQGLVIERIG